MRPRPTKQTKPRLVHAHAARTVAAHRMQCKARRLVPPARFSRRGHGGSGCMGAQQAGVDDALAGVGAPAGSASRADAFCRYARTAACPSGTTCAPRAHHRANSVAPLTSPAAVSCAAAARMSFTKAPSSAKAAVVPAAQGLRSGHVLRICVGKWARRAWTGRWGGACSRRIRHSSISRSRGGGCGGRQGPLTQLMAGIGLCLGSYRAFKPWYLR